MTPYVGAVGTRILARLLHGTLYAKALHILVGGNLRVDVVTLKNLCERHAQKEESHEANRDGDDYQYRRKSG